MVAFCKFTLIYNPLRSAEKDAEEGVGIQKIAVGRVLVLLLLVKAPGASPASLSLPAKR